jgi:hypothetical protein
MHLFSNVNLSKDNNDLMPFKKLTNNFQKLKNDDSSSKNLSKIVTSKVEINPFMIDEQKEEKNNTINRLFNIATFNPNDEKNNEINKERISKLVNKLEKDFQHKKTTSLIQFEPFQHNLTKLNLKQDPVTEYLNIIYENLNKKLEDKLGNNSEKGNIKI